MYIDALSFLTGVIMTVIFFLVISNIPKGGGGRYA